MRKQVRNQKKEVILMTADRIFYGGKVITVDTDFSIVQAVAVCDGKIVKVGSDEEVKALAGDNTELCDLGGKTMIPGMIDAHGHLGMEIKFANWANLKSRDFYHPAVLSVPKVVEILKAHIADSNLSDSDYVLGFGYHESRLEEKRFLNKFDLDQVSTTQPVIVANISLHTFSFNSFALKMLGVDENTPDPGTSKIYRVEGSNEPTGTIQGPLAQELIFNLSLEDMDSKLRAFEKAQDLYFSVGLTTAQEGKSTPVDIEIFDMARKAGKIRIDIASFTDYTGIDEALKKYPFKVGEQLDHVRICGIKMISDGTLAAGAYLSRPFEGTTDNYGIQYIPFGRMKEAIRNALLNNWQFCVHTIGDAAIDKLMDAYEEVLNEEKLDPMDYRNVINHATACRINQLPRVKKLNMIISFYPSAASSIYEVFCMTVGKDRADVLNPMRSAFDEGIVCTMHNDAPIIGPDPFIIMWSAVNRVSVRTGTLFAPEQRITIEEALRALTINGAYQHGEEEYKGSIEVGKNADLVILSMDPLSIDPLETKNIKPLETIKDGITVYKAV